MRDYGHRKVKTIWINIGQECEPGLARQHYGNLTNLSFPYMALFCNLKMTDTKLFLSRSTLQHIFAWTPWTRTKYI